MITDKYSNPLLTKEDGRRALLYGHSISNAIFDDEEEVRLFNKNNEQILGVAERILNPLDGGMDVQEYHDLCATDWNIPAFYKILDVKSFLLAKCKTEIEVERVNLEYAMFEERKLIPLLQFLVFIVDHMRDEDIVWGVGRGSSVASYCLYLLGVHKVDSIKYDLPIEEFLK
jgi:DNA polymerase III alpha subunit